MNSKKYKEELLHNLKDTLQKVKNNYKNNLETLGEKTYNTLIKNAEKQIAQLESEQNEKQI